MVSVFKDYKNKGFDVVGISMDKSKKGWLKAIEKDHLNWTNLSELKGMESEAAKLYGIQGIPSNFLIDSKGIIIAKNLRDEKLREKISELLD